MGFGKELPQTKEGGLIEDVPKLPRKIKLSITITSFTRRL